MTLGGTERAPEASLPAASASTELTVRAVAAGMGVGMVLAIGNVYMGLKTNWWDSGNITAAILGFALIAPGARRAGRPYSIFENNVTQTVAGSAAIMPGALGLLGALPALELLGHRYPSWSIGAWGLSLAFFGILLAVPLRQRFVVSEKLPFPSAIATAEFMRAIHVSSGDARARTRALFVGLAAAMVITWFRDAIPAFIPGTIWLPFALGGATAESLTLGAAVSPLFLGAGMLVGARNGFSLLSGSVLAWGVLAPALVRSGVARAEYASLVNWLLWPGVALMVSTGLVSLVVRWRSFARALADLAALRIQSRERGEWVPLLLCGSMVVLLTWGIFGVHPVMGIVVVLASIPLIDVCVRTAGETDIVPLGPLGQLMQLLLGLVAPGAAAINVAGASVAAGAGVQSALTVNALKAGHVLGAPHRGQIRAQAMGALVGVFASLPAYALLRNAYGIGNAVLPAPGALGWKALADLAEKGSSTLLPGAAAASGVAAVAGVMLALLERTRFARFTPSPVAMAVAFLVPGTTGVTVAIGALGWLVLQKRSPAVAERLGASVAAGGIAGESLMGFVVAVLMALGVLGNH